MTTLIENGTVIGFDGEGHVILDGGVVAFKGNRIIHVGKRYSGIVDERVDARGKLVAPGFINAHCHSQTPVSPHRARRGLQRCNPQRCEGSSQGGPW